MSDQLAAAGRKANVSSGPSERGPARWSLAVASILFSAAAFEMLVLYSIVHWEIMFRGSLDGKGPPDAVFTVLGHLWWLRAAFAGLAFVWAIWSLRGYPKWAAIAALVVSMAALSAMAIVM
jgi:hypothetical protein